MPADLRTIAFLGGVPASLGGGGLERQRDLTAEALAAKGIEVVFLSREQRARPFDLLHVFGSEPDVWHMLQHWRRNPAPLVVSPVLVATARQEARLVAASRLPWPMTVPRMKRELLGRAALAVALTAHEAHLISRLAPATRVAIIGNGVAPVRTPAVPPERLPSRYVVLLGTVTKRKRQLETVAALEGSGVQPVVVGGYEGTDAERAQFERAVDAADGVWLGEIFDAGVIRAILARADALIHLSEAEGQSLAVLEALSVGTPVICSPLPSHTELAQRYPEFVSICASLDQVPVLSQRPRPIAPLPDIPTWESVADELIEAYTELVAAFPARS